MTTRNWQLGCAELKQRGAFLFKSKIWADCSFQLDDVTIKAHKLIMAMASPVFARMVYEEHAINPVPIFDVRPQVFNILLECIYSDNLSIDSSKDACDLYYVAKKWRLPYIAKECVKYLGEHMSPENVCHIYQVACESGEFPLLNACEKIFTAKTIEVIKDKSFLEASFDTVTRLFSLEPLNVDSELDLFVALAKYSAYQEKKSKEDRVLKRKLQSEIETTENSSEELTPSKRPRHSSEDTSFSSQEQQDNGECPGSLENEESNFEGNDQITSSQSSHHTASDVTEHMDEEIENNEVTDDNSKYRNLIKEIRFLTLTPREFAGCRCLSLLLTQSEILALSMNISYQFTDFEMPEGFTTSMVPRTLNTQDERARLSAVFRSTFHNFKNIRKYESVPFYVRNMAWQVWASCSRKHPDLFNIVVRCYYEDEVPEWLRSTKVKVKLCTHNPVPKYFHKITLNCTGSTRLYSLLWLKTLSRNEILKPEYGFVDDFNSVTYKVYVTTSPQQDDSPGPSVAATMLIADAPKVTAHETFTPQSSHVPTLSRKSLPTSSQPSSVASSSKSARASLPPPSQVRCTLPTSSTKAHTTLPSPSQSQSKSTSSTTAHTSLPPPSQSKSTLPTSSTTTHTTLPSPSQSKSTLPTSSTTAQTSLPPPSQVRSTVPTPSTKAHTALQTSSQSKSTLPASSTTAHTSLPPPSQVRSTMPTPSIKAHNSLPPSSQSKSTLPTSSTTAHTSSPSSSIAAHTTLPSPSQSKSTLPTPCTKVNTTLPSSIQSKSTVPTSSTTAHTSSPSSCITAPTSLPSPSQSKSTLPTPSTKAHTSLPPPSPVRSVLPTPSTKAHTSLPPPSQSKSTLSTTAHISSPSSSITAHTSLPPSSQVKSTVRSSVPTTSTKAHTSLPSPSQIRYTVPTPSRTAHTSCPSRSQARSTVPTSPTKAHNSMPPSSQVSSTLPTSSTSALTPLNKSVASTIFATPTASLSTRPPQAHLIRLPPLPPQRHILPPSHFTPVAPNSFGLLRPPVKNTLPIKSSTLPPSNIPREHNLVALRDIPPKSVSPRTIQTTTTAPAPAVKSPVLSTRTVMTSILPPPGIVNKLESVHCITTTSTPQVPSGSLSTVASVSSPLTAIDIVPSHPLHTVTPAITSTCSSPSTIVDAISPSLSTESTSNAEVPICDTPKKSKSLLSKSLSTDSIEHLIPATIIPRTSKFPFDSTDSFPSSPCIKNVSQFSEISTPSCPSLTNTLLSPPKVSDTIQLPPKSAQTPDLFKTSRSPSPFVDRETLPSLITNSKSIVTSQPTSSASPSATSRVLPVTTAALPSYPLHAVTLPWPTRPLNTATNVVASLSTITTAVSSSVASKILTKDCVIDSEDKSMSIEEQLMFQEDLKCNQPPTLRKIAFSMLPSLVTNSESDVTSQPTNSASPIATSCLYPLTTAALPCYPLHAVTLPWPTRPLNTATNVVASLSAITTAVSSSAASKIPTKDCVIDSEDKSMSIKEQLMFQEDLKCNQPPTLRKIAFSMLPSLVTNSESDVTSQPTNSASPIATSCLYPLTTAALPCYPLHAVTLPWPTRPLNTATNVVASLSTITTAVSSSVASKILTKDCVIDSEDKSMSIEEQLMFQEDLKCNQPPTLREIAFSMLPSLVTNSESDVTSMPTNSASPIETSYLYPVTTAALPCYPLHAVTLPWPTRPLNTATNVVASLSTITTAVSSSVASKILTKDCVIDSEDKSMSIEEQLMFQEDLKCNQPPTLREIAFSMLPSLVTNSESDVTSMPTNSASPIETSYLYPVTTAALPCYPLHAVTLPWPTRPLNTATNVVASLFAITTAVSSSVASKIPTKDCAIDSEDKSMSIEEQLMFQEDLKCNQPPTLRKIAFSMLPSLVTNSESDVTSQPTNSASPIATSCLYPLTTAALPCYPLHAVTLPWPTRPLNTATNVVASLSTITTAVSSSVASKILTKDCVIDSEDKSMSIEEQLMFQEDLKCNQPPTLREIAFSMLPSLVTNSESDVTSLPTTSASPGATSRVLPVTTAALPCYPLHAVTLPWPSRPLNTAINVVASLSTPSIISTVPSCVASKVTTKSNTVDLEDKSISIDGEPLLKEDLEYNQPPTLKKIAFSVLPLSTTKSEANAAVTSLPMNTFASPNTTFYPSPMTTASLSSHLLHAVTLPWPSRPLNTSTNVVASLSTSTMTTVTVPPIATTGFQMDFEDKILSIEKPVSQVFYQPLTLKELAFSMLKPLTTYSSANIISSTITSTSESNKPLSKEALVISSNDEEKGLVSGLPLSIDSVAVIGVSEKTAYVKEEIKPEDFKTYQPASLKKIALLMLGSLVTKDISFLLEMTRRKTEI